MLKSIWELLSASQEPLRKVGDCLNRYSSNGVYYARFENRDKEIRRSLNTTDRALAKRRLADIQRDFARVDLSASKYTLAEMCERYAGDRFGQRLALAPGPDGALAAPSSRSAVRRFGDGSMSVTLRLAPDPARLFRAACEINERHPALELYDAVRLCVVGLLARSHTHEQELEALFEDNAPDEDEGQDENDDFDAVEKESKHTLVPAVELELGGGSFFFAERLRVARGLRERRGERRAKLAEFERLVGKGFTEKKAARLLGLAPGSVAAMRRSVESPGGWPRARRSEAGEHRSGLGPAFLSAGAGRATNLP